MKKILYSLVMVALGLTSCNSWDDPTVENYGDGPATSIAVTTKMDSTFTFTVTPASGTLYYSYVVVASDEVSLPSASTLLKGAVSGVTSAVQSTKDVTSVTVNMRNAKNAPLCTPNTTYQIYAVAASDKGVTGEVASATVTTSDGNAPVFVSFANKDSLTTATFSENVALGSGSVSAKYYKEWDITNPVTIDPDSINIVVKDATVGLTVNSVPAGAYVVYSWTEGAFVDSYGNKCPALNSTLDMTTGKFSGVYIHLANEPWAITDSNITSPKSGSVFATVSDFKGVLTFDKNIYRNDDALKGGEIAVVYTNSKKTTTVKLSASDWSVSGSTLTFTLPETPGAGDIVTAQIAENAIFDVYGNGNNAFTSKVWWKYFAMTKNMVLGNFKFTYYSAYDDTPTLHDGGTITISEDASKDCGLVIKNLYLSGSEVSGYYDISTGKIYIYAYQTLGLYTNSKGVTYGLITYSLSGADEIPFTVNADGTIVSTDFAVVACDENYESAIEYFEKCSQAIFTPVTTSAAKRMAATRAVVKSSKAKKVNVKINKRALKRVRR